MSHRCNSDLVRFHGMGLAPDERSSNSSVSCRSCRHLGKYLFWTSGCVDRIVELARECTGKVSSEEIGLFILVYNTGQIYID